MQNRVRRRAEGTMAGRVPPSIWLVVMCTGVSQALPWVGGRIRDGVAGSALHTHLHTHMHVPTQAGHHEARAHSSPLQIQDPPYPHPWHLLSLCGQRWGS